jgi:hypothetical protein
MAQWMAVEILLVGAGADGDAADRGLNGYQTLAQVKVTPASTLSVQGLP